MKFLLIGSGAREHALAEAICRSAAEPELVVFSDSKNPAIAELATEYVVVEDVADFEKLGELVERTQPELAVAGPENPIAAGATDFLAERGVFCFAPTADLAQLEASKSFARELLIDYGIPGAPEFAVFDLENASLEDCKSEIKRIMEAWGGEFVVKADGLKSGKGVKVTGDHLAGVDDGLHYAVSCLEEDGRVVIEEKLDGEEFSYIFLTDGQALAGCPVAQDHKRVFEGDKGPNTGGMGTYSDENGGLPFISAAELKESEEITQQVLDALKKKTGKTFKGVMYGGFMATKRGVKLIEYNVRFGDPEAMNILPILKTDFVELIRAIRDDRLAEVSLEFEKKATVCKYAIAEGYPNTPTKNEPVEIGEVPAGCRVYFARTYRDETGQLRTGGGREIAFVGIADTLAEAEQLAEAGVSSVTGRVAHRSDIATAELIARREAHMAAIRG